MAKPLTEKEVRDLAGYFSKTWHERNTPAIRALRAPRSINRAGRST